MIEERVLKQLGLVSLTVHDLEAGHAKYEELQKEIRELETESAGLDAQLKDLRTSREKAVEKLAEEKQIRESELAKAKEVYENAVDFHTYRRNEYTFAVQESEYGTDYTTEIGKKRLEKKKQEVADAQNAEDIAAAQYRVAKREYADTMKEVNKIDQEYSRIYKQFSNIDKRLTHLNHLSTELFWELDRLERNKEYFLNKEKG
ncbi:MAG: hypothetical protein IKR06_03510 [Erysipelotrichaceae bacterium]|nr:hypothetical protein [Erysipelotrichaceae bacterium]